MMIVAAFTELADTVSQALQRMPPSGLGLLVAGVFTFYIVRFALRVR